MIRSLPRCVLLRRLVAALRYPLPRHTRMQSRDLHRQHYLPGSLSRGNRSHTAEPFSRFRSDLWERVEELTGNSSEGDEQKRGCGVLTSEKTRATDSHFSDTAKGKSARALRLDEQHDAEDASGNKPEISLHPE